VKDLVEKSNVDVDILDERHRSPLHRAAWFGQTPTLAYLLLVGAFKDGQDCNGRTPLALAARFGHAECVRLLVQYGADAGARDEWGKVPGEAFAPSVDAATRRRVRDLLAGVQEKNKQAEDGATGLQKLYRGHAARKAARAREESEARRERFQTAQEEELLRLESAITIQCAVRCYLARNAIVAQWATANAPAPVVKDSHQALPAGVLYGDDKRAYMPAAAAAMAAAELAELGSGEVEEEDGPPPPPRGLEVPEARALQFLGISGHFTADPNAEAAPPGSPRAAGASPRGGGGGKTHTEYHIQVRCAAARPFQEWRVCRRYNDFDALYHALRRDAFALPDLPPKRLFGAMDHAFVIERQHELEKWLAKIIENSKKFADYTGKDCQKHFAFREFMAKDAEVPVPEAPPAEEEEQEEPEGGEGGRAGRLGGLLDFFTGKKERGGGASAVPLAIRKAVQYHHAKNYARELCRDKNIVKFVDDEPVTIVAGNPNGGLHKAQLLRKAQSTRVT